MSKELFDENRKIPMCPECGVKFDDIFEAVNHLLEDDEQFDPALILPGGYRLLIGSLLRMIYENRHNPIAISDLVQDCYGTLFAAEIDTELLGENIEDIFVETAMENFDVELKKLFKNGE